ncbi:MAG: tetratricopeptide repeat protein [Planctomycetes bacterium]|nr:tetratricopeptide repeat protein [Planctomycetota bacterium]
MRPAASGIRVARRAAAWALLALGALPAAEARHLIEEGKDAPAFALATLDGGKTGFDPGAGRVRVILFARPDQPRSLLAVREAARVRAALGGAPWDALLIIPGAFDPAAIRKLASDANWKDPVLIDPRFEVAGLYGAIVTPAAVIVGRDGKVSHGRAGYGYDFEIVLGLEIRFALGEIDRETKQKLLREARGRAPSEDRTSQIVELALRVADEGDLAKADELLGQAEKLAPASFAVRCARAEILVEMGEAAGALEILDALEKESDRSARVRLARGRTLAALDRTEEAEKELIEAIRISPAPARAHYELGRLLERRGDKDGALREYRLAIEGLLKVRHW